MREQIIKDIKEKPMTLIMVNLDFDLISWLLVYELQPLLYMSTI